MHPALTEGSSCLPGDCAPYLTQSSFCQKLQVFSAFVLVCMYLRTYVHTYDLVQTYTYECLVTVYVRKYVPLSMVFCLLCGRYHVCTWGARLVSHCCLVRVLCVYCVCVNGVCLTHCVSPVDVDVLTCSLAESHRNCGRVQDAYALRCVPQVRRGTCTVPHPPVLLESVYVQMWEGCHVTVVWPFTCEHHVATVWLSCDYHVTLSADEAPSSYQVHGIVHDTISFTAGVLNTELNGAGDNPVCLWAPCSNHSWCMYVCMPS